jgi:hypothetical protein
VNPDLAFAVWARERQNRIEHALATALPAEDVPPSTA